MCYEKFTFNIVPFLLINSFVLKIVAEIICFVLETEIAFVVVSFVITLWAGGSLAVEDDEEREADQPEKVVLTPVARAYLSKFKKSFWILFLGKIERFQIS